MSDVIPLPPRPDLDHYRRLSKELLAVVRTGDPDAVGSWARRWLERLRATSGRAPGFQGSDADIDRYANLVRAYWSGDRTGWKSPPPRRTLAGTQFFLARIHGFDSWARFARHVQAQRTVDSPTALFEAAADAVVAGDTATLRRLLDAHPGLIRARSSREHRSTLLHYVSANGIEDFRQKTPPNILEITGLLLHAGADVTAECGAYGGGSTTLGLTATSAHPAAAGVMIPLLETLLAAGADVQHRDGGWAIVRACLANGQPEAARWLAAHGAPADLADALGIGRLDIVERYLAPDGALMNGATDAQLEEGFRNASWYRQVDAIRYLLDAGFDVRRRFEDGSTALHHAAYDGHPQIVELLLARAAPIDVRDERFDGTPWDWAEYASRQGHDVPAGAEYGKVLEMLERAAGGKAGV